MAIALLLGATGPVRADVPPAEADVPPAEADAPPAEADAPPAEADAPPAEADAPPAERLERSLIPAVKYNNDDGFGVGLLGVMAGFKPPYHPFQWRAEVLSFLTLRLNEHDQLHIPTQAHWLLVDFPGLLGPHVRLRFQLAFAQLNRFYYGLGNETPAGVSNSRRFQFERAAIPFEITARISLPHDLYLVAVGQFTYNFMAVYDDSLLAKDLALPTGSFVRDTLHGIDNHALLLGKLALEWDTRDHEVVPLRGMLHTIELLGGGGVGDSFAYGAARVALSFYQALADRYLVLAARVMGDAFIGQAPLDELPYLGGPRSVRGVPIGRFRGKARALANLELRSRFLAWGSGADRFHLGAAAFVDTGRVWADYQARPDLDGTGHGLKIGTGGGIRFQWGETVLLRFDAAWSPEGHGYYLDINHAF